MQKKEFSLSYYFDEIERRGEEKVQIKGERDLPASVTPLPATATLFVLKALMGAEEQALPLTALARRTRLKIGLCQEIVEQIRSEGLVGIKPDDETGNDLVYLTEKGADIL